MTDAGPYWGNSNLPQGQRRTCSFCSQEWDDNRPTHVCGNQVVAYDDLAGLVRACDELRAENERLRESLHRIRHLCNGAGYVGHPVISDIFAEAGKGLARDMSDKHDH